MPINLKSQKLQCPFCSTVSTRGTGLSAHVRSKHSREYRKWNKNPNRLLEAAAAVSPPKDARKNRPLPRVQPSAPVTIREEAAATQPIEEQRIVLPAPAPQKGDKDSNGAFSLLQKAYEQLSTRKQSIENELARIEELRGEHEAVAAQVAALDQAMKAFHQ